MLNGTMKTNKDSLRVESVEVSEELETVELDDVAHVCVRGEWIPTSCVQFIDIEEDAQGFDVMTFEFEGQRFTSHVQLRPIPK